jgi:hypothetical protein
LFARSGELPLLLIEIVLTPLASGCTAAGAIEAE